MDDHPSARSPLDLASLQSAAGERWEVTLVETVDSTNRMAGESARLGQVVVAEHQTAGRGRLDRSWVTPAGAALTFSVVVAPRLDVRHWGLVPLAAGMAVADGLRAVGVQPALKWPNDVLVESGKVAGVLVERVGDPARAVIGIGINVDLNADELPVPTATALSLAGVQVTRTEVFGAVLTALAARLVELEAAPEAFVAGYRALCDTVGRQVEAHLPGEVIERGQAVGVDELGRLQIEVEGQVLAMAAGDVVHLRPAGD